MTRYSSFSVPSSDLRVGEGDGERWGFGASFLVSPICHAQMPNLTQGKTIVGLALEVFFCHSEGCSQMLLLFVACDAWLPVCTEWLASSGVCEARACFSMYLLSQYDNLQKCLE